MYERNVADDSPNYSDVLLDERLNDPRLFFIES